MLLESVLATKQVVTLAKLHLLMSTPSLPLIIVTMMFITTMILMMMMMMMSKLEKSVLSVEGKKGKGLVSFFYRMTPLPMNNRASDSNQVGRKQPE